MTNQIRCVACWTAIASLMLLAASGCPTAGKKHDAGRRSSHVGSSHGGEQPQADDSTAPPKLPVDEFRELPAMPPSEPLPRQTEEPSKQPVTRPASLPIHLPADLPSNPPAKQPTNPPVNPPTNPPTNPPAKQPVNPPANPSANQSNNRPVGPTSEPLAAASDKPILKTPAGKYSGVPFDPVKQNGPIFVDWPKPKATIVITGMEDGYIEPCGCAGLDRMKGGMGRRYAFLQQVRQNGWPLVVLDAGGIARGFGRQAELKFQTLVESKLKMGYNAIAFGATDLRLPAGELISVAAGVDGKPGPFTSANVGLLSKPGEITPRSRVFEAGGVKVGVTAVFGASYQKTVNNPEIEFVDPVAALSGIVPELKRKSDYLVLLSHATMKESVELAKKFPQFNAIVVSDGNEVPPDRVKPIPGTNTLLITVGHKGMDAIVLGLYDDRGTVVRYQRVPLDSRWDKARDAGSPEMKLLMAAYQDQLKTIGFAGLGLRPSPHPLLETNGRFVGSAKCESCHEDSYNVWKKSKHAHAYETLAKLDPPRNYDPECVSCHVVGWHPTNFFPYASGYESKEKTPHLTNVGCEDCHGPGERHCAAELGGDKPLQQQLRKAMIVTKAESKKQQCVSCHDLDNSPDFNFDAYWPQIEHHEEK